MSDADRLNEARRVFMAYLGSSQDKIAVLHDFDADGVTAGVVLVQALLRTGRSRVGRLVTDRTRSAWSDSNRGRLQNETPDRLFILDLGSRSESILPGVPTCFIDHHRPAGIPPGGILISSYDWEIIPNTSLLVWDLCSAISDVSDLDWIAAIGVLSDLGETAPFPLLAHVFEKYDRRSLKEATVLVNAVRRASRPDPEIAVRALLAYSNPRELMRSTSPEVARMREARQEVNAAMNEAKKRAPVFSNNVALIRVHSTCQVHPLIAQIWRSRLPRYIVMVANEGYLPGYVNFSVRSSSKTNALDFLQGITLPHGKGEYGHGHDQATGGSLPIARWNQLLAALEFPQRVFAIDAV